jgi:hypothetical protein
MLLPLIAPEYVRQLELRWQTFATHPDFKLWNVDLNYSPRSGVSDPDFRKAEWVSLVDGKVVGYFCAIIDKSTYSVADISAANFDRHPQYSRDFLCFLKRLRRQYRVIRWACVAGHPNERFYGLVCKHYGGRKVGVFTKKVRLHDGRLYDEAWYELIKHETGPEET